MREKEQDRLSPCENHLDLRAAAAQVRFAALDPAYEPTSNPAVAQTLRASGAVNPAMNARAMSGKLECADTPAA